MGFSENKPKPNLHAILASLNKITAESLKDIDWQQFNANMKVMADQMNQPDPNYGTGCVPEGFGMTQCDPDEMTIDLLCSNMDVFYRTADNPSPITDAVNSLVRDREGVVDYLHAHIDQGSGDLHLKIKVAFDNQPPETHEYRGGRWSKQP